MTVRSRLQRLEKRTAERSPVTLEALVVASTRDELSPVEQAALDASPLGRLVLAAAKPEHTNP